MKPTLANAYPRVVGAARCVAPVLAQAARQLRVMSQCKACGDFDTNPQARAIEGCVEALRAALDAFDLAGGVPDDVRAGRGKR